MANRKYVAVSILLLAVIGIGLAMAVGPMFGGDGGPSEGDITNNESDGHSGENNFENNDSSGENNSDDTSSGENNDTETDPDVPMSGNESFPSFTDVTSEAGIEYETVTSGRFTPGRQGAYVADINNDGYEDLLLVGGKHPTLFESAGSEFTAVRRFDPFDSANVSTAHFFDYDNDGSEDLLLLAPNRNPVMYENRDGEFVRRDVGLNRNTPDPRTVTSADFTGNGCLDVYIGSWQVQTTSRTLSHLIEVGKKHPELRPNETFLPGPTNLLFAGDCTGFEDITEESNVNNDGATLAVSAADFTGNGHIDIHVGNDVTSDYIYENQGNASFEPIELGPASDRNAMSSVAMDVTGNNMLDIFVTNIHFEDPPEPADLIPAIGVAVIPEGNNLFVNQGDGEFVDTAPEHGLERGSWGWAASVADFTNDGNLDTIHASMYVSPGIMPTQPEIYRPPQVWRGTNDSWEKVNGFDIGLDAHNFRGLVRIDYNGDGALDFVAPGNPSERTPSGTELGSNQTFLYENQLDSDEFLQLLVDDPDGIDRNAAVYIETDERTVYREANARGNFLSQRSRLIHVGLTDERLERVVVEWPDGEQTVYDTLEEGERYVLAPDGANRVERRSG